MQHASNGTHENGAGTYDNAHHDQSRQNRPIATDTNLLAAQQRDRRPLYQIIENRNAHPDPVLIQAQVDSSDADSKSKPRMSLLLACIISALASSLISVSGYHALMLDSEPPAMVLHSPLAPEPTATAMPTATPAPLTIFVSGAVRNVGVYDLPVGARIEDAISRAGGLLPDADPERVNRAMKLFDGAQIHIPYRTIEVPNTGLNGVEPNAEEGLPPPSVGISGGDESLAAESSSGNGSKIDLNAASQTAIESLPGIGASKAQEIIAGRPYSSVNDLQKVSGIGAKTVDKLREFVTAE